MPTKQPSTNQHDILHLHYPNDCCLCKAETRIKELEKKVEELSQEQEPKVPEKLRKSYGSSHSGDIRHKINEIIEYLHAIKPKYKWCSCGEYFLRIDFETNEIWCTKCHRRWKRDE